MQTCNYTAMNENRFGQPVCKLVTADLRTNSKAADNIRLKINFKKGGIEELSPY